MANQENFETTEWNFDNDLALGPDASKPPPNTPYERAKAMSKGFGSGALSALSDRNTVTEIIDHTLPSGYGQGYRAASDVYDTAKDLYKDAKDEVGVVVDEVKETLSKFEGTIDKVLPEKLAGKIKGWIGTRKSLNQGLQDRSEAAQLREEVDSIFAQGSSEGDSEDVKEAYYRVREEKREEANISQLDSIRIGIEKLTNYQDKILVNYQRKSLEVQLRQLQVSAKLLDVSKDFSLRAVSALDTIKEESRKPDLVKLQEHPLTRKVYGEKGENERNQGLFGRGFDSLRRMRERIANNARNKLKEYSTNFIAQLRGIGSVGSMQQQAESMGVKTDPFVTGAEFAGAELPKILARRFGYRVREKINESPLLRRIGNQIQYGTENIEQMVKEEAREDGYKRDAEGNIILNKFGLPKLNVRNRLAKFISNTMGEDKNSTALQLDTIESLQEPAVFSKLNARSINTVIPGLLARIHQEVRKFRTGDENAGLIGYDLETGQFTDSGVTKKKIIERVRDELGGDAVSDRVYKVIDQVDADGQLSDSDREALAKKLLRDNYDRRLMSPERMMDSGTFSDVFDDEKAKNIATIFQRHFNDDVDREKRNEFARDINALSNDVQGSRLNFQSRINVGQGDVLREHGLEKDGSIDIDKVIELLIEGKSQRRSEATGGFVGPLAPIGPTDISSVNNAFLREAKENLLGIKEKAKEAKDSLKEKIKENGIRGSIKAVYNKGKDTLGSIKDTATDTVKDFYDDHKGKITTASDYTKNKFNTAKDKADDATDYIKEKTKDLDLKNRYKNLNVGQAFNNARGYATDFYSNNKDKITDVTDIVKDKASLIKEKAEPIVEGAKGAAKQTMAKVSNTSLGSLAGGAIMGSAQIARTAFMKPIRFLNFLGRRSGDAPMPNVGNMASGMSVNEALPILLNYRLTQGLQGINTSVKDLIKETRDRYKEPEAGSSEDIRRKRKDKKEKKEIDPKEAVKGGGLAAIGGLLGKLFGIGKDGEEDGGGLGAWGTAAAAGAGALATKAGGSLLRKGLQGIKSAGKGVLGVGKTGLGLALKATPVGKISRLGEKLLSSGAAAASAAKPATSIWGKIKRFTKFGLGGLAATTVLDSAAEQYEGTTTGDILDATSTAVSIGSLVAMFGGTGMLASAASAIGTAAAAVGSVLASPVALGAAAVGGIGYGTYRYFTRVEFDDVNRVRMAQYGFDTSDRSLLAKIIDLENLIAEKALYFNEDGIAGVNVDKLSFKEVAKALDVSSKDQEVKNNVVNWLIRRFIPVYIMHVSIIKKMVDKVDTRAIEDFKDVELLGYLRATRFKGGPYEEKKNPFSSEVDLNADSETVEILYQRALIKLEKKVGDNKDKKNKVEAIARLGGKYGDTAESRKKEAEQESALKEEKEGSESIDLRDKSQDKVLNKDHGGAALVVKSEVGEGFEETDIRISAINALRYRIYGLKEMELDKVRALEDLEREAGKFVSFGKEGEATFSGSVYDNTSKLAMHFGISKGGPTKYMNLFRSWFTHRFLPVYLKAFSFVYKKNRSTIIKQGIKKLTPIEQLDLARLLLQTTTIYKGGVHEVCKIIFSPWDGYVLANNYDEAILNLKSLEENVAKTKLDEEKQRSAPDSSAVKDKGDKATSAPEKGPVTEAVDKKVEDNGLVQTQSGNGLGPYALGQEAMPEESLDGDRINVTDVKVSKSGDYQLLPDPKGDGKFASYREMILEAAKKTGTDPYVLANKIGDYSKFVGKDGFIDYSEDEWKSLIDKFGKIHGISPEVPVTDVKANVLMIAEELKELAINLQKALPDMKLGQMELYLADQLGLEQAVKLLKAENAQTAKDVLPDAGSKYDKILKNHEGKDGTVEEVKRKVTRHLLNVDKVYDIGFGSQYRSSLHHRTESDVEAIKRDEKLGIGPDDTQIKADSKPTSQATMDANGSEPSNLPQSGKPPVKSEVSLKDAIKAIAEPHGFKSATDQSTSSGYSSIPETRIESKSGDYGPIDGSNTDNTVEVKGEMDPRVVTLVREPSTDLGTFGKITIPGPDGRTYDTLELPWKDNKNTVSCIPNGKYTVYWRVRPEHKKKMLRYCYAIANVPGRAGVLIHPGRYGGDTSKNYKSHVEGCIMIGFGRTDENTGKGFNPKYTQAGLVNTPGAVDDFVKRMGRRNFTLEIMGGEKRAEVVEDKKKPDIDSNSAEPTDKQLGEIEKTEMPDGKVNPDVSKPYEGGEAVEAQQRTSSIGDLPPTPISQPVPNAAIPEPVRPSDVMGGFNPKQAFGIADQRQSEDLSSVYLDEMMDIQRKQLSEQSKMRETLERIFDAVKQKPAPIENLAGDARKRAQSEGNSPSVIPASYQRAQAPLSQSPSLTVGPGAVTMRRNFT